MVKSHVKMAKTQMKGFSFLEDNSLLTYSLMIEKREILRSNICYLGTEDGYYSNEVEQMLNENVESLFGNLISKIRSKSTDEIFRSRFFITEKNQEIIKRYIYFAILRSKYVLLKSNDKLIKKDLDNRIDHNQVIEQQMNFDISDFQKDKISMLIVNETNRNFVAPSTCFYIVNALGGNQIVLPISAQYAILLVKNSNLDEIFKKKEWWYFKIDDSSELLKFNERALESEMQIEKSFIISKTKEELEILQDLI